MHFTLVFNSAEGHDLSFGLVFVPNPCWVRGDDLVLNLNPLVPHLEAGSVRRLVDIARIRDEVAGAGRRCALIVHSGGHGTAADLALLVADLERELLDVTVSWLHVGIPA